MGAHGVNQPGVSVVVPTYNRADILPRAIRSVLNQTYDDFELLIVDDGSTDNTENVVQRFSDKRITYVKLNENKGAHAARNQGIKEATGEYVSFLDSDDELTQRHLEVAVERLTAEPASVAGVCTGFETVTQDGTVSSIYEVRDGPYKLGDVVNCNVIGSPTCTTFRQQVFETVGDFDENLPYVEDHEFYIRVLKEYEIAAIDEILARYHVHEDQISNDPEQRTTGRKRIVEKHSPLVSKTRTQKQHVESVDWDWLLVCSGGRYDILTELSSQFLPEETSATRVPTDGTEHIAAWMKRMFPGTRDGLFVHAGEPIHWRQDGQWDEREHFETVPAYTEFEFREKPGICGPKQINDVVREYLTGHDSGVVRYPQPRPPFREMPDRTKNRTTRMRLMANAVRAGDLSPADVAEAYRDNFAWVLEEGVSDLLSDLNGTVVVTADHGECLGDCGQWFHSNAHDPHPHLVTVPWAVVS